MICWLRTIKAKVESKEMKHAKSSQGSNLQLSKEPVYGNLISKAIDAVNDLKKDVKKMNKIICKIEEKVSKKHQYGNGK